MKKVILALSVVASLAACGTKSSETESTTTDSTTVVVDTTKSLLDTTKTATPCCDSTKAVEVK
jgi:ABC-type uncharacterized transport system auxiliary subunit